MSTLECIKELTKMKREKKTAMKTDEKGTRMEILNAFE